MKTPAMFDFDPPAPRQLGLITRCLLVLPPAFLLSLKYDLPHIVLLTALLLVVPLFQDRSFRLRDRPIVYSLLGAGILAIVPGLLVKIPDTRLTFSDYLMRSHQFLPFLLYSAAISFWFRRTREITALCMLVVLLSCLACGDVYNTATLVNVSFAGTTPLLRHYRTTFLVCAVLQCFGTLLLLTAESRYDSTVRLPSLRVVRVAAVLLLIPALLGVRAWFFSLEDEFREWRSHLQQVFQSQQQQSFTNAFPPETGIGDPSFLLDTPVEVILQAVSPRPPGYLRGNVYRAFSGMRGGMWYADEKNPTDLVENVKDEERNLAVLTFLLDVEGETDTDRMELRFNGRFRSRIPPLPGNATSVTLDAKSAAVTRDGCVVAENWNPSAGVVATVHGFDPLSAGPDPDATYMGTEGTLRAEYLALPPGLEDQLVLLTDEIFGDADPMLLSPKKRIDAVVRFFSERFAYSLGEEDYSPRRGRMYAPIVKFLYETRSGHCELFATAAALLLRMYGVPSRYVVGIVCNDLHPAGYYYATNFDLHAWVEAWLDDESRWTLVEATPAGGVELPGLVPPDTYFALLRARIAFKLDNMVYWFRRGYPMQAVIQTWDRFYGWASDHVRQHPVRSVFELVIPVSLLAAAILWFRGGWWASRSLSRRTRRLARMMRSLQLNIWRRTGVQRESWQTYQAWANALGDPLVTDCVVRYEAIRYAGRPPLPDEIRAFEDAVKAVKRHMPKRRPIKL